MPIDPSGSLTDVVGAVDKLTAPDPSKVPAKPETLADVMSTVNRIVETQNAKSKEEAFKARQLRMQKPIVARDGETATAAALGVTAGLVRGLFTPVQMFIPDTLNDKLDAWEEDSVRKTLGMMSRSDNKTAYMAAPATSRFLAALPTSGGELAGSVAPFIKVYDAARELYGVEKAVGLKDKIGKSIAAASTAGGVFSIGARLDPGESRWSAVAMSALQMGAWETVGIPAMRKAVLEESKGSKIVSNLVDLTGRTKTEAEVNLAHLRAGLPVDDDILEHVLQGAKVDPEFAKSPVVLQAAKQRQAQNRVSPRITSIDPLLADENKNFVARATFSVDGTPFQADFVRDDANPSALADKLKEVKSQFLQLSQNGADVQFESLHAGRQEDLNEILSSFTGTSRAQRNPDPKKRGVPGAAPKASIAENGKPPVEGDIVTVKEPDKPPVRAKVVANPRKMLYNELRRQQIAKGETPIEWTDFVKYYANEGANKAPVNTAPPLRVKMPGEQEGVNQLGELLDAIHGPDAPSPGNGTFKPIQLADDVVAAATRQGQPSEKGTPEQRADAFARANDVQVELTNGERKIVPLAHLQVPLEVKAANGEIGETLRPQLDGSPRNAIVHLDERDISFEPLGADPNPSNNLFRSEVFNSTGDPSAHFAFDPRMTIHGDKLELKFPDSLKMEGADKATAKRTAKLLLDRGVPGDTVVRSSSIEGPSTISDLSRLDLPHPSMQVLQDEAAKRGFTVNFQGLRTDLKAGNRVRVFEHPLDAMEAVLKTPLPNGKNKVEGLLEQAWRMGSERAHDPDIDVTRFLPVSLQEQGVSELLAGKRPLVPVYTKDPNSLTKTLQVLEQQVGITPGTMKVQMIPAMDQGGRKAAVLYSHDAVATQAAKHRDVLNYLGVSERDPAGILRQLSTKGQGHGIYVLAGRDAESAALYAHYRDLGSMELWQRGRIEADSLGPYRRFSKEQKAVVTHPGTGDEAYFPADLSDAVKVPEGMSFTGTPKQPPIAEPEPGFYDDSGAFSKLIGNRIRPTQELFKDLEVRTGVPFYSAVYRPIEVARQNVTAVLDPVITHLNSLAKGLKPDERKQVQVLLEARYSSFAKTPEYEATLSPKVKDTATTLGQLYEEFAEHLGFKKTDVSDFFKFAQTIRQKDGNFTTARKGESLLPKLANFLERELTTGEINLEARELDFQKLGNRITRAIAQEKLLKPEWDKASTTFMAYVQQQRVPGDYIPYVKSYMQEVLHMPDHLQQSMARFSQQLLQRINSKWKITDAEALDFASMATQMNYFTNLAYQPGQVARNMLQTLQTLYPFIGNDTFGGWKKAMQWWKDPVLQREMIEKGITQGSTFQPLQEFEKLLDKSGSTVSRIADAVFTKGSVGMKNTDDWNRVAAYFGAKQRAYRVGQEYLDKKINWGQFLEKSGADMRDAPNGPFVRELKALMDGGSLEKVASRYGEETARATQYVYTRGNAPFVMQSTAGRFLLQYGTWPAWYVENLRAIVTRGSPANRVKAAGRWLAVQGAMFETAKVAFGVDLSRWIFFSPLGYTGGPFMQLGLQASQVWNSAVNPSDNDPVANIARKRLAGSFIRQITPLPIGAATNALQAIDALNKSDPASAARQLLGFPAAKP